ncbi:MAG: glycosyl transferase family 1 [Chloroflexi bacterium RBG_16_57_9]|nr:MAG: glycosyl transferase family 1 [Chloroflexi bacterium RBG_16_57_9]
MVAPTSFFGDYGCHVRILEEARILEALGNQVTIVTYFKGRDVPGVRIERTRPVPWRPHYDVGSSRHKLVFDLLLAARLFRVALRDRPDVIHAHTHEGAFLALPMAKLWRVPLVLDFQGSMSSEMVDHRFLNPHGPFYRPVRWLETWLDNIADVIITSSYHAEDLLVQQFGCRPEKIFPIPDGVNPELFHPRTSDEAPAVAQLKAQLGIPPDRQVVVYLGLLAEYQGTNLLLQAAAQVLQSRRDVHFLVMGYPGEQVYRRQAGDLGLNGHVTFTGRIPYEYAPQYLALGDIAVAPKLSATEGSGKLLNYMAMGLPIVAFDTPVSREYLSHLGVYAPPSDAAGLAKSISMLVDDPAQARKIGLELREQVMGYSWPGIAQRILDVYDYSVLSHPARNSKPRLKSIERGLRTERIKIL